MLLIRLLLYVNVLVMVYLLLNQLRKKDADERGANTESLNISSNRKYKNSRYYKEKFNLLDKIENIILKSNIRKYIPWVNSKVIFGISLSIGILVGFISFKILNNIITSLVLFGVFGFIPTYLLEILSSYNNSKVERNFLYFLNILMNFAQLKDDVYFAFEKSVGYVEEPLNGYTETFLEEVKRGLPVEEALDNFKDKLENNKFKLFLKNAKLCVKYGGSFLNLTASNLETMKHLQMEKAKRKSETSLGRTMIYIMMGINIALAVYMFGLYPDTLEAIRNDFYGQVIVLINTVNLFIVFYLSLRLQKIDY